MSEQPIEVIGSRAKVKELLTEEGVPSRPFKILSDSYLDLSSVEAVSLAGMRVGTNTTVKLPSSLRTLDGVFCEYAAILRNCDNVKTLGNAFFESRVRLEQLCNLQSLDTATFGNAVELHGMPDGVDLGTPELSDDELRIVQQIVLDRVEPGVLRTTHHSSRKLNMSVNYDAYVVIGLAVTCKTVSTYETRYDEKTGKPYQKQVSKDYWETTDHRPLGFDPCELEDRDSQKLQFFTSDSDQGGVVGCKLAQTSNNYIDGAVTVPGEDAQLFLWSSVVKQLEARGCAWKPELLLVMTRG